MTAPQTDRARPDEADSADVYARRIAYLRDASTIRARTIDMFGRGRAPSLEKCERYRQDYLDQFERAKQIAAARADGLPYRTEPADKLARNAAIIAAYIAGRSSVELACEFSISAPHVARIVSRAGVARPAGSPKIQFNNEAQRKDYIRIRDVLGSEQARKACGL